MRARADPIPRRSRGACVSVLRLEGAAHSRPALGSSDEVAASAHRAHRREARAGHVAWVWAETRWRVRLSQSDKCVVSVARAGRPHEWGQLHSSTLGSWAESAEVLAHPSPPPQSTEATRHVCKPSLCGSHTRSCLRAHAAHVSCAAPRLELRPARLRLTVAPVCGSAGLVSCVHRHRS